MFRYLLIILILFILFGYRQLMGAWQSLYIGLGNYYESTIFSNNSKSNTANLDKAKWEKYKRNKNKYFFSVFNKNNTELNSWNYYKKTFITQDGRVIDHQRGSVTTSEGQAYAMMRAFIMGDKETFDKIYDWTKYNLQHKHDNLFAWLWGQKNLGTQSKIEYGIIDQNGATDAGTEIAISLVLASKRWMQENYLDDALKIINDIWDIETTDIKGERILVAGVNQNAKTNKNIEVNPSYFMPYSFRIFAEVDKEHDWQKLVDSSYRLVNWSIDNIESGLPPDSFYINRKTGAITYDKNNCDFSYDAVRVFYRFYVDYSLTKDPRAKKLLSRSKIFIDRWNKEGTFYTCYEQNGELKNYDEAMGSIALLLPVIKMYDKKVAAEIYQNRIEAKYNKKGYWGDPMDYYAQNLVWFGNWLYQNEENVRSFKY